MWFALTKEMFAVAPSSHAASARLSVGSTQTREDLSHTLWARVPGSSDEHLLEGLPFSLRIARADVLGLGAVEPWPSVRVRFRSGRVVDDRVFRCETPKAARSWGRAVEGLFEAVAELGYDIPIERGWLAVPDAEWQDVDALPVERASVGVGAYRSAERAGDVVARRPPSKGLETMLAWLMSAPERPFKSTPNEVVLTRHEVFVRFHGGRVGTLPRKSLNRACRNSDGDVSYRFGRHLNLLLPYREGCEVVSGLNAQLEAGAAGSSA